MAEEIFASVQVRRDNKANWEAANPILLDGEAAYEKDTDMFKIGDGINRYTNLPYHNKVGPQGEPGPTPQISMNVSTGNPGTSASVNVTGTAENPVINLTVPRGDTGKTGSTGPKGDTGSSGVYIGTSQPTDSNINVWIDSDGEPTEVIDDLAREEISSLKNDITALNAANAAQDTRLTALEQNAPSGTSGLTVAQVNALNGMFKVTAFTSDPTDAYSAFKSAFGITDDVPDTPIEPEVTLTGISASYTGGDVAVGTSVNDLNGITVTATYSDGSTETVTDYTLSGEIGAGNNTITVNYGGMTATFVVVGVAGSGDYVPLTFVPNDVFVGNMSDLGYKPEQNSRAVTNPLAVPIISGHTYKVSLGEATGKFKFGVSVFTVPDNTIDYSIVEGEAKRFANTGRKLDAGWQTGDYTFTAEDGWDVVLCNFAGNSIGAVTNLTNYTDEIAANFTITEVV